MASTTLHVMLGPKIQIQVPAEDGRCGKDHSCVFLLSPASRGK